MGPGFDLVGNVEELGVLVLPISWKRVLWMRKLGAYEVDSNIRPVAIVRDPSTINVTPRFKRLKELLRICCFVDGPIDVPFVDLEFLLEILDDFHREDW